MKPEFDFYFITDRGLSRKGALEDVGAALSAGVKIVQYREKGFSTIKMLEEASQIRGLCRGKAVFIVNDRVDIAAAVGADGVHLGKEDMPLEHAKRVFSKGLFGCTARSVEDAVRAERRGFDYISLGPIFHTTTKVIPVKPLGVGMIKKVRGKVKLPLVAVGGIKEENVEGVISAGADAAAMISDVLGEEDVCGKIKRLREKILKVKGEGK